MRRLIFFLTVLSLLGTIACKKQAKKQPAAQPSPTPQSATAMPAPAPIPGMSTPWKMAVTTRPNPPAYGTDVTVQLKITDDNGKPVGDAQAKVALEMVNADMPRSEWNLVDKGNGTYEAVTQFSKAGQWKIMILAYAQGKLGQQNFLVVVPEVNSNRTDKP